jgi:hypothetical protein
LKPWSVFIGWIRFRQSREAIDAEDVEVGGRSGARGPRGEPSCFAGVWEPVLAAGLQLFALLVLRQFLRTDYRGVVALVAEWAKLRRTLGLTKVPHYSTLAHAARRLLADAEAGGPSARLRTWWSGVPASAA